MTAQVGRVDHPVVAVYDIQATRAKYQKLGFIVPPVSRHEEWGTENLCIMFPDDYLEIRGIGDPNKFLAGVDKFLEKGQGLYSVAFNAQSADDSYRKGIESGLSIEPPRALNRKLVLENKTLDLQFKTVMLGRDLYPGLTHANLCEHLTAQALRQPEWLNHPNGVLSFGRLVGVVSDFDAAENAYKRLIGQENVRREPERILLNFGKGADVELISAKEAEKRGDNQPERGEAYLASAILLVNNLKSTECIFNANGIHFNMTDEGILKVCPDEACGAHIYFKQA